MLATMTGFAWVVLTVPGVAGAPICLYGMMVVVATGLVVVASKVRQSEKGVILAGDVAERDGYADPIAPVTKAVRRGCGTGLVMLAFLAVAGIMVWVGSATIGGL